MPPKMNPMDSTSDQSPDDSGSDDLKTKLLGLTQLLQAIESIAGDELKPYLDEMIQNAHMKHESMESPEEESTEQKTGEEMNEPGEENPKGAGIEIGIGMGKPESDESEESDEDTKNKPKGLLAILATRAKKPQMSK